MKKWTFVIMEYQNMAVMLQHFFVSVLVVSYVVCFVLVVYPRYLHLYLCFTEGL